MADMFNAFSSAISPMIAEAAHPVVPSGQTAPIAAGAVVALCVVAGLATWLLLPGKHENAVRRIGAVILSAVGLVFAALLARWTVNLGGMSAYFWIFSAIAIFGSIRVITHTKPVYSALYFVLTVFATAGLFVLMWAEFMAAALVLIYAGAILITYVFVIMLASEASKASVEVPKEVDGVARSPLLSAAIGFALAGLLIFLILDQGNNIGTPSTHVEKHILERASAPALGEELIAHHPLNLQLAAIVLTIAMVGAITLARRRVIVSDHDRHQAAETFVVPGTPTDDNPHSIPVYGTTNPRQKAYPEN